MQEKEEAQQSLLLEKPVFPALAKLSAKSSLTRRPESQRSAPWPALHPEHSASASDPTISGAMVKGIPKGGKAESKSLSLQERDWLGSNSHRVQLWTSTLEEQGKGSVVLAWWWYWTGPSSLRCREGEAGQVGAVNRVVLL